MIEIPECLSGTMGTILSLVLSVCSEVCSLCGFCVGLPGCIPEIGIIFTLSSGCCCDFPAGCLTLGNDLIFELCPALGLF